MSRVHTVALSVLAVGAVGALAACSSSGGSGASSSTSPTGSPSSSVVSTSASSSATDTSAAGSVSSSTTGSNRSGAACAESQLRASVASDPIPGLGYHVLRLNFKNISTSTCTLTGFPGAAIVDDSGKQVRQATRVVGGAIGGTIEQHAGTVPVKPGASVFAYLEGQSTKEAGAAQAGCDGPKFPRILVTPPNTDTAVPFTIGWPQCYSFNVHPVREQ